MKDVMCKASKQMTKDQLESIYTIKGLGNGFYDFLESLPNGREVALAKTKLEEAVMWAVKGTCVSEG